MSVGRDDGGKPPGGAPARAARREAQVQDFLRRAQLASDAVGGRADDGEARGAGEEGMPARARVWLGTERAKYLDAIEDIDAAYVATDLRGLTLEANSAAARLLNCDPVTGRALIGFVARGDTPVLRKAIAQLASRERDEITVTLRLRRRGGPVFAAQVSARVLHGIGRRPVGLRWLLRETPTDDPSGSGD
jgi:PAS domain S-box-containing protein